MDISDDPPWRRLREVTVRAYEDAVVYGDFDQEQVLHEGDIRLLANGWVELPTGRLLSPDAVHHIDVPPELPEEEASESRQHARTDSRDEADSGW